VLPALSTRNPLYLSLVLLAAAFTYAVLSRRPGAPEGWGSFVRFSAFLWLLTIPFTALTAHYGTIVLFTLPESWPIIGGPITLEALLYGLTGGLALLAMLLSFAAFNVAVDQARLLRMTPGFAYQAGVVAAIAVSFVPQMVLSWQLIREAQQVRGHRVRGVRDLLPVVLPLLITALERSINLAESMEARGFGGQATAEPARRRLADQAAVLAGLGLAATGLALAGFLRRGAGPAVPAAFGIAGLLVLGWGLWDQGRRARRTLYHRWIWSWRDRAVLGAGLVGAGAWLVAWLAGEPSLNYYPYPPFSPWPGFNPALGFLLALLVIPVLLLPPAALEALP
jgi:energy-coupling factor transport system permease protein